MKRGLFLFRRDLRVADNSGLLAAAADADEVVAGFVLDTHIQRRFARHERRNTFLMASLADLDTQVTDCGGSLRVFTGDPCEIVRTLLQRDEIHAVYVNRDYTPFARRRDAALAALCREYGAEFNQFADALLNEPESVLKADGTPYVVFTPYHRAARAHSVPPPAYDRPRNIVREGAPGNGWTAPAFPREVAHVTPGRQGAISVLRNIEALALYEQQRDFPALPGTSMLSAHLRFGTCSVREAWHHVARALGPEHALLRQLHWRDFFTQVAFHFPHVFGHAFRRQYDRLRWRNAEDDFAAWCEGRTGFPIVDAAMHELVETGYMHNRARMIVASFLVKNLHIDWRAGEAFFARHLVDYDPSVNNGNWQWAASTGCDAQPYFRVFNPWRQQQKFDPEAAYIKRWVPALTGWPAERIHKLEKNPDGYLAPLTNLKESAESIKAQFRSLSAE